MAIQTYKSMFFYCDFILKIIEKTLKIQASQLFIKNIVPNFKKPVYKGYEN